MGSDDDVLIEKAQRLATDCKQADVSKNQVQQVLAHLRRQRSIPATLRLLEALQTSCFAQRTRSTGDQFKGLKTNIGNALRGQSDWRRGARLLGWTCRCLVAMEHDGRKH